MEITELVEKRIDENVASYDIGTLESYKYLIEMIAIEYHNEQLRVCGVLGRSERFYCDERDRYGNTDCTQQCMSCVRDEQEQQ